MFKQLLHNYWHAFGGISNITRVMLFEKFTVVFFFFYLLSAFSLAFILSVVHWSAAVIILLAAFFGFSWSLSKLEFIKRMLIRKGDRVEYADPYADQNAQIFKKATVILKMRYEEAKKSQLISEELMEGNRHFYLVETEKKPTVLAYDWIISISPEMLEV